LFWQIRKSWFEYTHKSWYYVIILYEKRRIRRVVGCSREILYVFENIVHSINVQTARSLGDLQRRKYVQIDLCGFSIIYNNNIKKKEKHRRIYAAAANIRLLRELFWTNTYVPEFVDRIRKRWKTFQTPIRVYVCIHIIHYSKIKE